MGLPTGHRITNRLDFTFKGAGLALNILRFLVPNAVKQGEASQVPELHCGFRTTGMGTLWAPVRQGGEGLVKFPRELLDPLPPPGGSVFLRRSGLRSGESGRATGNRCGGGAAVSPARRVKGDLG